MSGPIVRGLTSIVSPGNATKVAVDQFGRVVTLGVADLSGSDVTGILAAGRFPVLTGDVSTPGGSLATTLAIVNANVGSYTLASIQVDAKGRVLAAAGAVMTGSGAVVLDTAPTIIAPTIARIANLNTDGFVKSSGGNGTLLIDTSAYITGNQTITLSGDATGSGATAITVTLANVNASPNTYALATITVNAKGLVTNATGASTTGSGSVVLATSPTIVTPVIASFAGANHNHQNSAGGGTLDAAAVANGTLDNARVNWAAPGAIGSTTPTTGAFTTLTASGITVIGSAGANTAMLNVNAAASGKAAIFQANATTPGNIVEWQDSTSAVLASVSGIGLFVIGSLSTSGNRLRLDSTSSTAFTIRTASDKTIINFFDATQVGWQFTFVTVTGSVALLTASMVIGTTSSHAFHMRTNSTIAMSIDTSQQVGIGIGSGGTTILAKLHIQQANSGKGLIVQAAATTPGSLTEWQSNAGAVLASISSVGLGTFAGLSITDATNIALGTTTGTKIGTATSQKLALWNATPIVQPTTAIAGGTLVSNLGTPLTSTDTIDGYTLLQIVKVIRNIGAAA